MRRIRERLPLNAHDRDTFYAFEAKGSTDIPFYDAAEQAVGKQSGGSAG